MDAYSTALKHYLDGPDIKQEALAELINRSQPAVHRYANGQRFPDAETARLIDAATSGIVSFALWQSVAMKRLGIGEAPVHSSADAPKADVSSPDKSDKIIPGEAAAA